MRKGYLLAKELPCLLLLMWYSTVASSYPSLQRCFLRNARRSVQRPVQFRYLASSHNKQPQQSSTVEQQETLEEKHNQTLDNNTTSSWSRSTIRTLRRGAGSVASTSGFLSSVATSSVTDPSQFRRCRPTVKAFQLFLQTSGIDLELSSSLNYHLLRNVVLLGRIQTRLNAQNDRRQTSASKRKINIPSREEALRYMRYSTAVYGSSMIAAAEMDAQGKFDTRLSPLTSTRISEHINLPEEDIVLWDVDYGGDGKHLRHFVALDRVNRKVVLSIRGTFTLSEIVVDVAAFSRPCFGGEAHSEMMTMAERVWEAAGETVNNLLEANEDYEFIVTGHSLGAGCACLLNIMCHNNRRRLIQGRKMRCFAYAAPPVFTALELIPGAVKSTTNYIHETDVVPFLSVDSVRHVFSSVRVIEEYMQTKLTRYERVKLSMGITAPDEDLIEAVRIASSERLEPKIGAPRLAIPAAASVWMREQPSGEYDYQVCDPVALSKLGLTIGVQMVDHHLPPRYEHAIENLMDDDDQTSET